MDGRLDPVSLDCSLSLILPAYNEESGITRAILEADEALAHLGTVYEILVVDDGSSDGTSDVVRGLLDGVPALRLVRHEQNLGYGAALRSGFEAARGQRIAFTDADCQFHLADLGALLSLAEAHPVVVGFRVDRQDPWQRRFFSRGYNLLARTLLGTGVRDVDCALKVFQRPALLALLPESRGFFVNTEMLTRARLQNLDVAEVGVRHRPRRHGASKVSLLDIPKTLRAFLPFWWTQVAFAGPPLSVLPFEEGRKGGAVEATTEHEAAPGKLGKLWFGAPVLLLLVMASLLFLGRLGTPLLEPEEARYAEISRQMLAERSFVTPVLHGEVYLQKPPLLYWLVMGSYQVFGVHDWSARLVASVSGILIVLLVYFWGKGVVGSGAAFAGAAMLCLSARFIYLQGMLTLDCLLCLWVVLGWKAAHRALAAAEFRWRWWLLSACGCGLGLLTKGPVALALVLPPVIILVLVDCRLPTIPRIAWLAYGVLALALAAPWYGTMAWQHPQETWTFFWLHNVRRFVTPFDHEKAWWFFLPGLALGTLPWSLLVGPGLVRMLRRSATAQPQLPAAMGFFLLAFAWVLAFYSLAGCKRAVYVLPALPALALALGAYFIYGLPWRKWAELCHPTRSRWDSVHLGRWATHVTLLAAAVSFLAAALGGLWTWGQTLAWAAGFLAAGYLLLRLTPLRRVLLSWGLCGGVVFALLMVSVFELLPDYHAKFGLRGQVKPHAAAATDSRLPVASYPKRWDSISFYLKRGDVQAFTSADRAELLAKLQQQAQTLLFIKTDRSLEDVLGRLPATLEFLPQGRQGLNVLAGVVRRKNEYPPP